MIGTPPVVASGNRTVRGMTVWNPCSPNASTSRCSTSRRWMVWVSNRVASRPSRRSRSLSRSCTLAMVSCSSATPRSAKYSHSSGTSTLWAAVSALTVSRPSAGWQSMSTTS